jgi:endonuclease/exonuclease/phosphatase family metal-dependent hydrolase
MRHHGLLPRRPAPQDRQETHRAARPFVRRPSSGHSLVKGRRSRVRCGCALALGLAAAQPAAHAAGSIDDSPPIECEPARPVDGLVSSDTLDVVTLNIGHGRGTALNQLFVSSAGHRRNLEEIAAVLTKAGADVVALQEADGPSLWSGRFDHVAFLADAADYGCVVHGHHARGWLYTFGAALMSRVAMQRADSHAFRPSPPTTTKGFVRGTVRWRAPGEDGRARDVTVVSIHLDFSRKRVRDAQVAELGEWMADRTNPLIVLGDFNEDWSLEDSAVRRIASDLGLQAFTPDAADFGTYKRTKRLDWILISRELEFVDYAVLPDVVSDHRGVIAEIGWAQDP